MNDTRIDQLLRMAVEADELEAESDERPAVLARVAGGRVVGWGQKRSGWVVLATAACAALAFAGAWVIGVRNAGSSHHDTSPIARKDAPRVPEVPAGVDARRVEIVSAPGVADAATDLEEQNVVLAIFHDPFAGNCCVTWREHDWNGNRCLTDVPALELTGIDVGRPCMPAPRQKLLVALAGPVRDLPTTDAKASELAACILGGERMCDSEGSCYAAATRECLPANVSFRIETVATNR